MPYSLSRPPKDLVKRIKKRHPKAGKNEIKQFIHIFNSSQEAGDSEATSFAKAWGVLNKSKKLKSSHRKTDPAKTKRETKKQDKKKKKKKKAALEIDLSPGGLADKESLLEFNLKSLLEGLEVEMEHTDNPFLALEIATDHLVEHEDYYDELDEMEEELEKKEALRKVISLVKTLSLCGNKEAALTICKMASKVFLPGAMEASANDDAEDNDFFLDPDLEEQKYQQEIRQLEEESAWESLDREKQKQIADKYKRMKGEEGWVSDEEYDIEHADIIEMLQRYFSEITMRGHEEEDVINFLQNEVDPSELKLLESFIKEHPSFLGSGAYGAAFEVGGGKVIKLFEGDVYYGIRDMYRGRSLLSTDAPGAVSELNIIHKGMLSLDIGWAVMEELYPAQELPFVAKGALRNLILVTWTLAKRKVRDMQKDIEDLDKYRAHKTLLRPEVLAQFKRAAQEIKEDIFRFNPDYIQEINEANETLDLLRPGWIDEFIKTMMIRYIYDENDVKVANLGIRPYDDRFYDTPFEKSMGVFVFFDA